jgi:predicted nucleic acid binding AN1-type Zn finger protein
MEPHKKTRCSFPNCKEQRQRIAGDCDFCGGHLCARHRLLEDHKCTGLDNVSTYCVLFLSSLVVCG